VHGQLEDLIDEIDYLAGQNAWYQTTILDACCTTAQGRWQAFIDDQE
jgi:hypothetical protein